MSHGYGARSNPYDQRGPRPNDIYNAQQQSYNASRGGGYESQSYGEQPYEEPQPYEAAPQSQGFHPRYNGGQPAMGRDNYGANVEMEPLAPNGSSFGRQQKVDPILDACTKIGIGIDAIENNIERLEKLQQASLESVGSTAQNGINIDLDKLSSDIMALCQARAGEIKAIKQQPDSVKPRYASQVKLLDNKLKSAMYQYQTVEEGFRRKLKDQMVRQYKIVNPSVSDDEATKLLEENPDLRDGVFAQAFLRSNRQGQSRAAANAVQDRHKEIKKIENQLITLANLFKQMDELVVQQEEAVTVIEQKGEEVVENIQGGNEHLVKGVKSAQARNRKKWWCLLICVIIVVIIVIIVVIYVKVINPPKSTKRSLEDVLQSRHILVGGLAWIPRGRSILPSTPPVPAAFE